MTPTGWIVIASVAALVAAAGAVGYRFRSRILHVFRPKRRPGDKRRKPVEKKPKPPPGKSLDGAIALRENEQNDEALALLEEIDQGKGLRRLLRAAALLEAGEDPRKLGDASAQLGGIAIDAARARAAAALAMRGDAERATELLAKTASTFEPATRAWVRVSIARAAKSAEDERAALCDLLLADEALARTVAARELAIEGAEPASAAVERYGGFSYARDAIAKFGAASVATLLAKVAP